MPDVAGSPQPAGAPSAEQVGWALWQCTRHFPSIFAPPLSDLRLCVAAGCDEVWPCGTYREAVTILRAAGFLISPSRRHGG